MTRYTAVFIGLFFLAASAIALAAAPAATLTGAIVESVDAGMQSISIKTKEGQAWTLRVADPELLKKTNLRKGDQITVEIDTNNSVTKIARLNESNETGSTGMGSSESGR